MERLPAIEGRIVLDEPGRRAASRDFGRGAAPLPLAVAQPATVDDVVSLVRFARAEGLPLAARGQAHTTAGQALAPGGVLLDMRSLCAVHTVDQESTLVDAGARWRTVLDATLPAGLAPPTLTDYQELTVGGTLSVGGVGGEAHRAGAQVDNVLALDVVTGAGDLVTCSPTEEPDLFWACLGGLGQTAILCRARLRLAPAPATVRSFYLKYDTLAAFLGDLGALAAERRFPHLYGNITAQPKGGWDLELVATCDAGEGRAIDRAALLHGLSARPGAIEERPSSYRDFTNRVDAAAEAMKAAGLWDVPHPWLDLFVPAPSAEAFIAAELARLDVTTLGHGGILLYPLERTSHRAPCFALPATDRCFLFDVFRNALPPTPEHAAALVTDNRRAYERCRDLGGTLYPIGSTPMSPSDWEAHFGAGFAHLQRAKQRFDPGRILTPGPGVFG
ncbi:MAG: FAD-binding protein [Byssovorax sp.]